MKHYFESVEAVLDKNNTSRNGLDASEAAERLNKYGKNKLAEGQKDSSCPAFRAIGDPMVIVLIAAAIISGVVSEIADMVIILSVVVLNSVLGVVQGKG